MATPEMLRPEDVEETALAKVDVLAHEAFGHDDKQWSEQQWLHYFDAIATVHASFHPEAAT